MYFRAGKNTYTTLFLNLSVAVVIGPVGQPGRPAGRPAIVAMAIVCMIRKLGIHAEGVGVLAGGILGYIHFCGHKHFLDAYTFGYIHFFLHHKQISPPPKKCMCPRRLCYFRSLFPGYIHFFSPIQGFLQPAKEIFQPLWGPELVGMRGGGEGGWAGVQVRARCVGWGGGGHCLAFSLA